MTLIIHGTETQKSFWRCMRQHHYLQDIYRNFKDSSLGIKRLTFTFKTRSERERTSTIRYPSETEHSYQPQTINIIMSPSINQFLVCTAYLLSLCAALVWTQDCHCGLPGTIVKFKSCKKKPAAWRSHDHPDINLTGSCLPEVPVK